MRIEIHRTTFRILAIFLIALIGQGCAAPGGQRTFDSPDAAVKSLVDAVRAHDRSQLDRLFGPNAEEVLSSGDEVADHLEGDRFVQAYDQKHILVLTERGSSTLVVGNQDWPLPIPIIRDPDSGRWQFDTAAGLDEIINRRIGQNELNVIKVCQAIVDAQIDYAQADLDQDGILEYATKFISDPGTKDGLYWDTAEGEKPSPLGLLIAAAAAEGYSLEHPQDNGPRPYHGYYYRLLTAQGEHAPGGAIDYMVNGKLIGGFAVIAWPSNYGSSGIMSFLVDADETVYQKDLGEQTDDLARKMTAYDPDSSWRKAE